ncbi:MAG: restriction endonuclease subunit S [Oscillospiraceae bacterium]|nr:restriction endonuclease subunit S [Oscillospiraceae bacterium]
MKNFNQSSFASVDINEFSKFKFPFIHIDKQKHIVSILDCFDKLCNNISKGLPAEIETRRKQKVM